MIHGYYETVTHGLVPVTYISHRLGDLRQRLVKLQVREKHYPYSYGDIIEVFGHYFVTKDGQDKITTIPLEYDDE